jgi:hypothetical protein
VIHGCTAPEIEHFPVIARHYVDLQREYASQLAPHTARS